MFKFKVNRLSVICLVAIFITACDVVGNADSFMKTENVKVKKNSDSTKNSPNGASVMLRNKIADYKDAKDVFWSKVYPEGHTIYCNKKFKGSWREGINVEHVFPMAWVKKSLNCGTRNECRRNSQLFNKIEADMHNLYPSVSRVNYERQSYRFGEVKGEKREFGQYCDFEVNKKKRVAEPRKKVRGDVARAMLYMEHKYHSVGLKLFNKQAKLMLKWHYEDRPSKEELRRNDVIEKYQGNRNPFIDNPKMAEEFKRRRKL